MKLFLYLAGFLGAVSTTLATPAQVIVIRHAEKPKDSAALHLSPAGLKRSKELVSYITTTTQLTRFGLPTALFASGVTKNGKGQRTGETLEPLSRELKTPIQEPFKSDEYQKLAHLVLAQKEYDGKSVLVCWTHEFIPQLVGAFGVRPEPARLDENVYDRVYLITFEKGKAKLEELSQDLGSQPAKHTKETKKKHL